MVAKKLRYINGHFYDLQTQQRIELLENIEVTLSTEDGNFKNEIRVGRQLEIKSSLELNRAIMTDSNVQECKKVFDAGTLLYFRITNDKVKHEFEVELLEDLYFYIKINSKKDEGKLYDCSCTVRKNTTSTVKMFEEVHGHSLNEIYKNTFVHYFGNNGSSSCNAIDRFYETKGREKESLINRYRKIEKGQNLKMP